MEGDHPLSCRPLQHHGHAPLLYPFSGFSSHVGPGMHQEEPQLLQVSIEFYGKGGYLAILPLLRSWSHSRGSWGAGLSAGRIVTAKVPAAVAAVASEAVAP